MERRGAVWWPPLRKEFLPSCLERLGSGGRRSGPALGFVGQGGAKAPVVAQTLAEQAHGAYGSRVLCQAFFFFSYICFLQLKRVIH